MSRNWALCMAKNSHRYIFNVANGPQEQEFIFKIAIPRFLHCWKQLALLWAKLRLFSCPHVALQPIWALAHQTVWGVWQQQCAWRKNGHVAPLQPVGAHSATSCPKCTTRQWGALTGHLRCIFFCPPATGYPGWRSGNARARCAGLRTPLGSCAGRVRRAAESAAAPAADHGRVRDGWCYEHQCHRAPSRGRLRRARQPQLRRSASSTFTRS